MRSASDDSATPADLMYVSGHLDGDPNHGQLTYLGGHSYPTTVPISANPSTNHLGSAADQFWNIR